MAVGESSGGGGVWDMEGCSGENEPSSNFPGMVQSKSNTTRYNCCSSKHVKCARWIRGSISDFQAAWAIRRDYSSNPYEQDIYNICTNPSTNTGGYVVWVGLVDTYDYRNGRLTWVGNYGLDNAINFKDSNPHNGFIIGQGLGFVGNDAYSLIQQEMIRKGGRTKSPLLVSTLAPLLHQPIISVLALALEIQPPFLLMFRTHRPEAGGNVAIVMKTMFGQNLTILSNSITAIIVACNHMQRKMQLSSPVWVEINLSVKPVMERRRIMHLELR